MTLDHCQTWARQNRSGRPLGDAIDLGSLGKVSNLSCAAVIGDGRQKEILNDGSQRDVRTEFLRMFQSECREFWDGVSLVGVFRRVPAVFRTGKGVSRSSVVVHEKRKRVFGRCNLSVIT